MNAARAQLDHEEKVFSWNALFLQCLAKDLAEACLAVIGDKELFHRHQRRQCTCDTVSGACAWAVVASAVGL